MCSHLRAKAYGADTVIAQLKTLLKVTNIAFPLLCTACPSIASAYDYTFSAYGPTRVVQGHDIYIREVSAITEGTRSYIYYYVDGLPSGATANWPMIDTGGWNGNKAWQPAEYTLRIHIPETTPTGTYNLTLRVESGGVNKNIPYQLIVDRVPEPLSKQVISKIPEIPSLANWEGKMKSFGQSFCNNKNITTQGTYEANIWFYDGIRVYYQIDDYYTKKGYHINSGGIPWNDCAGYVEGVYKPYVLNNTITGWRAFPHGLYMDYQRNHDENSKSAAILLATTSSYAWKGGDVIYGSNGLHRETAYLVNAYRIAGLLGSPNPTLYARSVDFLLGAIDQEFVSNTDPYLKPFMVGLMMEALIQYYDETKDPRVPPAIKSAADGLWSRAWMPDSNAFYYESTATPLAAAPDLNLLIAPAYAWLYKMTGDPVYQQRGDLIFQSGVNGAWLGDGKHFSQNYRWSFDYVTWRSQPDITPPTIPASISVKTVQE